jgi:hypothetical protein
MGVLTLIDVNEGFELMSEGGDELDIIPPFGFLEYILQEE